MKQILIGLLIGLRVLTACAPAETTVPVLATKTISATPSPFSTSTNTSFPTSTLTASITPLPTIPTFTPTFDVSSIITATPAPRAKCPEFDSTIKAENYLPGKLEYPSPNTTEPILDFLNNGGDGQTLIARLKQIYPFGGDFRGGYDFYDVTGDQSREFLYVDIYYEGKLFIFSCKKGKYELIATLPEDSDFLEYTMQVVNLNRNGIPEIIVMGTNGASFPQSRIYLYAWNGHTFTSLLETGISALRQIETKDINGDRIKEILLSGDNPTCVSCSNFIPQRQRTLAYAWNGKEFAEILREFEQPEFRFQAIQDADAAIRAGNYSKAIQLYKEAISNNSLDWWSPERFAYEQHIGDPIMMFIETPSAIPTEDLTEYPHLAAYAYYRIMLIHLVEGNAVEADSAYKSQQENFSNDHYGQPYVEMATEFRNAYQSTHKMYDGCAAAIQYAAEHPEILIPLGSDYHGSQSHTYVPADVCPFR